MAPRIVPLEVPYPEPIAAELSAMMPPGVPPLLLFRTLARNPRILGKIRASNLLDRGAIDRRDRELAILRTCARCDSEYEWGVHVAIFAKRFGLLDAEVKGTVDADPADPRWQESDRCLLRLVDELHDTSRISDALWVELSKHWSEVQLIELIVLIGFYHTISFITNGLEIDLEPAAERFHS